MLDSKVEKIRVFSSSDEFAWDSPSILQMIETQINLVFYLSIKFLVEFIKMLLIEYNTP